MKRQGRRREPAVSSSLSSMLPVAVLLLGYAGLLGYGVWTTRLPPIALGVLLLISLLAFAVYGFDKSAAQAGRWRTAESTLHLLSLAGDGRARGARSGSFATSRARRASWRCTGPPCC